MQDFNIGSSTIHDIKENRGNSWKKFLIEFDMLKNIGDRQTFKNPEFDPVLYSYESQL